MPVVTLPLFFYNSFWTQDYRRGLEILFSKLQQGVAEDAEIVAFVRARVIAERNISASLTNPGATGARGTGFDADDGASLLMAFRGLQRESIAQGEAHAAVARDLEAIVLDPFEEWASGHAQRVEDTRKFLVDGVVKSFEQSFAELTKLKQNYITKTRQADEAEDDAKFAPNSDLGEGLTGSPTGSVKRGATVSERISQRFRETMGPAKLAEVKEDQEEEEKPSVYSAEEKGKAKEVLPPVETTPARSITRSDTVPLTPVKSTGPTPILVAGIALSPTNVSALLARARAELPMKTIKIPFIGDYEECFTGEDITKWLRENVEAFGGSLDRAEEAARDLGEREGLWKRVGALGNKFESTKDAQYQFRPKAFVLPDEEPTSPESTASPSLASSASSLVKRSGTITSYITSAFSGHSEPRIVRLRAEADKADHAYGTAVRYLDRQRLDLEEKIEHGLKVLQSWEMERLRAVKSVLLQYEGTVASLPGALQASFDRSSVLLASYQPESDLTALIERYRTGPFRPVAHVYESVEHQGPGRVCFGIDLGNWAGEGGWNALRTGTEDHTTQPAVPGVLSGLLAGLEAAYPKMASDEERRKTWIYEVPLANIHRLREALNVILPDDAPPPELLAKFDPPVLAGTVKLWLLELNPPLGSWEGWDEVRRFYPSVGADAEGDPADKLDGIKQILSHLPKVYLHCLDAILRHFKSLVENTKTEEPNDVYVTKLALSIGRALLRPKFESELTIQDRHATLFFLDLVNHYSDIIPPVIARKQRESGTRPTPVRKRTAPVDRRVSRSSLTGHEDPRKLLEAQINLRNPRSRNPSPERVSPPMDGPAVTDQIAFPDEAEVLEAEEAPSIPTVQAPIISVAGEDEAIPAPEPVDDSGAPVLTVESEISAIRPVTPSDDEPISRSPSNLTRNTSAELARRAARARGPRVVPGGGRKMISSEISPSEVAHPHGPVDASEYAPRKKGGRAAAGLFAKHDTRGAASGSEEDRT